MGCLSCNNSKSDTGEKSEQFSENQEVATPEPIPPYHPETVTTGEWAQWRGPNRDGISQETGLLKSWPENGPKELWRIPLGKGFSGMSITKEGRLYTMFSIEDDAFVGCFDAASGKEIWRVPIGENFSDSHGDGPRGTPTVHDGVVYLFTAYAKVYALDAETGQELWTHDLATKFKAQIPRWGFSSSLLVEGDVILVETAGLDGHLFMGLDKKSGEIVWKSQNGVAGYSSPIGVTIGGVRQIIFFVGDKIMSISPTDGTLYWEKKWETDYKCNIATPIFIPPNKIFISSGYGEGSAMFQVDVQGKNVTASSLWETKKMRNHMSSCVRYENYLYGFDEKVLKCISVTDGKEKWKKKGFGKGSLVLADGLLIIFGDDGDLALAEVTPVEYREKSAVKVLDDLCWTRPSLADGKLYLRNMEEMVCLDIREP
ncbi:MAG: hypothetical protein B6244_00515 [Candidatus Cloacimonetes bacterium 4572_55]|nr:MAG: hypothetical protein B6244_00515 [Candidatus Cloacimonetes bacterium 4572_55]